MPATGDSPQELLLSHLDFIRDKVQRLCRRHRAPADTAEEIFGDLKIKLLADDCEVLRRFRGDAKLTTYLAVVINRFYFDWTAREWGSWRRPPTGLEVSAGAEEVEQLIGRDGFSRDEALRIATDNHRVGSGVSARQLDEAVAGTPTRWRPRLVELEAAQDVVSTATPSPEDALCATEAKHQLDSQLARALAALCAQDRLLVALRYGHGLSVASIARTLGLRQRELYTRIGKALRELRGHLQAAGVTRRGVCEQLAQMERLPDFAQTNCPLAGGTTAERIAARGRRALRPRSDTAAVGVRRERAGGARGSAP